VHRSPVHLCSAWAVTDISTATVTASVDVNIQCASLTASAGPRIQRLLPLLRQGQRHSP
jgi:hypothetical protein